LTRADLTGANLADADLTDTNLALANLTDANLTGANLALANLTRANLTRANLTRANLTGANLALANLTDADLTDANLTRADLTDADLTDANLTLANLALADLTRANLTRAFLNAIKRDFYKILRYATAEISGLRAALMEGKIDGVTYEGECACLVGTIANTRKCAYGAMPGILPNGGRPAERWFLAIRPGITPENNAVAALTLQWIDEFTANLPVTTA
jgi:hypothetical protein